MGMSATFSYTAARTSSRAHVVSGVAPQHVPTKAAPAAIHSRHAVENAPGSSFQAKRPSSSRCGLPALGRTMTGRSTARTIRGTDAVAAAREQQLTPTAEAPAFAACMHAASIFRLSPSRLPFSSMAKLTQRGMPSLASRTPASAGVVCRMDVKVSSSSPSTPACSNWRACSR